PFSSYAVGARGIEVWVHDEALAPEAVKRLEDFQRQRAEQAAEAARSGPIEVVCEECGAAATFPAVQTGTVQECPECGAFLDVGAEDGHAGDWGVSEDEEASDGAE